MEAFEGLYQNFLRFFSWEELSFLLTGTGLLVMLNLVLSEGLLSFDNALVLAILVSHLPGDRSYRLGPFQMSIQRWALTAGIFGAYFFRVIAIGLGTYLIQFWSLRVLANRGPPEINQEPLPFTHLPFPWAPCQKTVCHKASRGDHLFLFKIRDPLFVKKGPLTGRELWCYECAAG